MEQNNSNTKCWCLRRVAVILLIIAGAIFLALLTGWLYFHNLKVGSSGDRINILIMGKSGKGYAAPDLTDTLILASFSLKTPSATLISIPRDIWIPEIRAKINSAYYWGNEKKEFGGGLAFSKSLVRMIVGQPVDYAVVFDFSGFKDIVDVLGGIDVVVDRSFTDEKFPIAGRENDLCDGDKEFKCRYETIYFEKGITYMDGETALKFARSRYAQGEEGTDLARDARQQRVISAIKSKVLSLRVLLNPPKLLKVWKVVRSSVETDMDFSSMLILGKEMLAIDGNIRSSVVPDAILINPPKTQKYDYQYVFIPQKGDWGEFQNWVKDLIK